MKEKREYTPRGRADKGAKFRGFSQPKRPCAAKQETGDTKAKTGKPSQKKPVSKLACPVAHKCGGCQLTTMTYRDQLALKKKQVTELLEGICPVEDVIGMEKPFHYRNKVHAVLGVDKRGIPVSGVYQEGTHRLVPVKSCLIEDRRASAIIQTIVAMLPRYKLRIYNEYTHRGFLRHILIRTGEKTGQIMVVLVATGREFPGYRAFVEELTKKHPEITTVVLNVNTRETSMVLGQKDYPLYGDGYMEDILCGKRFRISPQSFFQVNAKQCEILYSTALDMAGLTGRETVLDAYCGTGTIGLCAADRARHVLGVELNSAAVRDAKENARINGIKNASFICEDAGRFMVKAAREGSVPDVVLMDPPRAGSDENFLKSLLTLQPPRIVYVSCNPETLARDLRYLVEGGYRAEKAIPVDMFPWTSHVETVVALSKPSAE
ncbi:MAG: 23S rRNA (uracil(1939)-C(5))-methyltransferase RlmD [Clostridia bacterium]|nr:23S rRNA (uracil(1939)-C(5))-methyltransferase RlmD [Clostridia bacterium]